MSEAAFRAALRRQHNVKPMPRPKKGQKVYKPPHAEGGFGGILNATNISGAWRRRKKPL